MTVDTKSRTEGEPQAKPPLTLSQLFTWGASGLALAFALIAVLAVTTADDEVSAEAGGWAALNRRMASMSPSSKTISPRLIPIRNRIFGPTWFWRSRSLMARCQLTAQLIASLLLENSIR